MQSLARRLASGMALAALAPSMTTMETRMATYGKKSGDKVEAAMKERSAGTLKSGRSGKKVTSRKQAIAIGLSEARQEGAKVPAKKTSARKAVAKKVPARRPLPGRRPRRGRRLRRRQRPRRRRRPGRLLPGRPRRARRRRRRRRARRRSRPDAGPGRPQDRPARFATSSTSSATSKGLARWAWKPASRARLRSSARANAVSASAGTRDSRGSLARRLRTSW